MPSTETQRHIEALAAYIEARAKLAIAFKQMPTDAEIVDLWAAMAKLAKAVADLSRE